MADIKNNSCGMVMVEPTEYSYITINMKEENFISDYLSSLISQTQGALTNFKDYYYYGDSEELEYLSLYDFLNAFHYDSEDYKTQFNLPYYDDKITNKYGYTFRIYSILQDMAYKIEKLGEDYNRLSVIDDNTIEEYIKNIMMEYLNRDPKTESTED